MKKLKRGFRKVFLIATVISLIFASCKQPVDEGKGKTEKVIITVKKDAYVIKAPDSLSVDKGSKLTFDQLKGKMSLKFEASYELDKITLNDASGEEITNTLPHTFNTNTTIFVSSRQKGSNVDLKLIDLKVDGVKIEPIADTMNASKTKKDKVSIEVTTDPANATIEFEPKLVDGFWNNLALGNNQLKIKLKSGNKTKEYTVNIERLANDVPVLKKLTVGDKSREEAEITEEMVFNVPQDTTEVEVKAETDPADATIVYEPNLTNGKLAISNDDTTLTIKVGTEPKVSTYTVKVKRLSSIDSILDTVIITGGRREGIASIATREQITKIISGEAPVIELYGPKTTVILGTKTKKWKSCKINGEDIPPFEYLAYGFTSVSIANIKNPKNNEIMDVKAEITSNDNKVIEVNFKIKRLEGTIDLPAENLVIKGKHVITKTAHLISLLNGTKPQFTGFEPTPIEILFFEDVIKEINIDGSVCEIKHRVDSETNEDIWYVEKNITGVAPSGKDITVVMEPKSKEDYHTTTWTFHLKYRAPTPIIVYYEINGKTSSQLDKTFVDDIEANNNPLMEIEALALNLHLTIDGKPKTVKINDELIDGASIEKTGGLYRLSRIIPLPKDKSEKQIEIVVMPEDESLYLPKTFKFRLKSNGSLEKITPKFTEISGDKNLPKSFLSKLSDGSKPTHKIASEKAKMLITLSIYEHDFLCKEVKINGELVEMTPVLVWEVPWEYKIEKELPIENEALEVKIEFIPKDETMTEKLVWEFKVEKGGEKPSIPRDKVKFRINGIGDYDWFDPLPESLTAHLTDGTNPIYEYDGKKALLEVGYFGNKKIIEKVTFKIDDSQVAEEVPKQQGSQHFAAYTFKATDTEPHKVELIIHPAESQYSPLIYTFRLKSKGNKIALPVDFACNNIVRKSGHKETIKAEKVNISVTSKQDVMAEVKIGVKASDGTIQDEKVVEIQKIPNIFGTGHYYEAVLYRLPLTPDVEKIFVIKVKAKDEVSDEFEDATCEFFLTGTRVPENNAEFVYTSTKEPGPVYETFEWNDGIQGKDASDYGAKTVTLRATTLSPRASVKYRIVADPINDKEIEGVGEQTMTNDDGYHSSPKITLFTDRPTKITAWVVAEDGHTKNDKKGVWKMTYNPISLSWSYENKASGDDYTTEAYNVIKLERDKITDANKKVYLVFTVSKDYTIDNSGLPAHQTAFEKIGQMDYHNYYQKTAVDVSSLLDSSTPQLEILLKLKKSDTECFTYKVKLSLK